MANWYVRDGASGSGTSWSDAYDQLTSAETAASRGDTIYVADGSYSGVTFNTATSGTTVITIKKATIADHGTETGWDNAYGDGQATIASVIFNSSYWVLDGVTGDGFSTLPADTTGSNYGFYISDDTGPVAGGVAAAADNITIRHCYLLGVSGDFQKWAIYLDTFVNSVDNWTISHCLMDRWSNGIAFGGPSESTGWVFEYNVCLRGLSTVSNHGEWINASSGSPTGIVIRYNLFKGMESGALTACIVANNTDLSDAKIYGNVFQDLAIGNGVISGTSAGSLINADIYNNTFIDCETGPWVGAGSSSTGQDARNNLVYSQNGARSVTTGDYNYYIDTTNTPSETNDQTGTGDPFVDLAGGDYRLAVNSDTGVDLGAPYNVDATGATRSTWTRGAFEFNSGDPTKNIAFSGTLTVTTLTVG